MEAIDALRTIVAKSNMMAAPTTARRYGTHCEFLVAIGNDHIAEITMTQEAYDALMNGEALMKEKTLHNSDISGAHKNIPDLSVVGDGDRFRLLFKASSQEEGWMKSTKAMEVPGGCVVQVTTQQRNPDGSYAVAEALTFVPGARIANDDANPPGRFLV